jgi:hypothetical protein
MKRWIESFRFDDSGNAVVGAIANIAYATLLTLSMLSLSLGAYNTLLIRDAAIEAAARAALPQAPDQLPYLRRLLDDRLPLLASFEIEQLRNTGLVGFRIVISNPVLGLLQSAPERTEVLVAKEELPGK